jgi:hypothetical protein
MAEGNSLINLGDVSKPATVLIEKISDAIGGYFKPHQIKRVAKAEAEAEIIKAQAQIEISDLQRRALVRFVAEEARKQDNIEQITQKAIPLLTETSKPKEMEDDWITNFFDKCRLISDSEMQSLWSRVLAGEANAPGSYSKRTVNFLSSLDKNDAELFSTLCTFGVRIGNVVPLIFEVEADIYNKRQINFNSLIHLESIGLIQFNSVAGFVRKKLPKNITAFYHSTPINLEFQKEKDNELEIGQVLLTKIGHELAPICGSSPDPLFLEYVRTKWKTMGFIKEAPTETNQEKPAGA